MSQMSQILVQFWIRSQPEPSQATLVLFSGERASTRMSAGTWRRWKAKDRSTEADSSFTLSAGLAEVNGAWLNKFQSRPY